MKLRYLVVGSGGHAKVVIDALRSRGCSLISVYDDDIGRAGAQISGIEVAGPIDSIEYAVAPFQIHIAIGSNSARRSVAERLRGPWATVLHRTAWTSELSLIGEGVLIGANAVVQSNAVVGNHVIINTAAVVEHDALVGPFSHIGPGAIVGGGSSVGSDSFVGTGAIILPGIKVGQNCTIGAGAVIIRDVLDHTVAVGIPGRRVQPKQKD